MAQHRSGASFTALSRFNNAPFHLKIVEGGDGNLYSLVLNEGGGISRTNGTQRVTAGLRQPTLVQDIALDEDQQFMIMADKGLFLRCASGWTTMGARTSFTTFAATPTGSMFVGGIRTSYASSNGGATWAEVDMPDMANDLHHSPIFEQTSRSTRTAFSRAYVRPERSRRSQPAPNSVFTPDNRAINLNGTNGFVDSRNTLYLLSADQGVIRSTTRL